MPCAGIQGHHPVRATLLSGAPAAAAQNLKAEEERKVGFYFIPAASPALTDAGVGGEAVPPAGPAQALLQFCAGYPGHPTPSVLNSVAFPPGLGGEKKNLIINSESSPILIGFFGGINVSLDSVGFRQGILSPPGGIESGVAGQEGSDWSTEWGQQR